MAWIDGSGRLGRQGGTQPVRRLSARRAQGLCRRSVPRGECRVVSPALGERRLGRGSEGGAPRVSLWEAR